MRSHRMLIAALVAAAGWMLAAQAAAQNTTETQTAAEAQAEQARQNAITDRYLTAVPVEMASKVDTRNAAVGQEVSVRTLQEEKLADGTELPRGTKLVGHVVQVKPGGQEQGSAILTLNFDRAEVKAGQSLEVRAVIRAVAPNAAMAAAREMPEPSPMAYPTGPAVGPSGRGSGRGGVAGGMPGTTVPTIGTGGGVGTVGGYPGTTYPQNPQVGMPGDGGGGIGTPNGGTAGSTVPSIGDPGSQVGRQAGTIGPMSGPVTGMSNRKVSDAGESVSGAPKATGLPGVMLWASPNASGTLTAFGKNFSLDSGMQITMGVIRR